MSQNVKRLIEALGLEELAEEHPDCQDVYRLLASRAFGVDPVEATPEQRTGREAVQLLEGCTRTNHQKKKESDG